MKTEHTPEPWEFYTTPDGETVIAVADGGPAIASIAEEASTELNEADAERIVACVNACKGLNPEAVPDLLAALGPFTILNPLHCPSYAGSIEIARAAIAKATNQ